MAEGGQKSVAGVEGSAAAVTGERAARPDSSAWDNPDWWGRRHRRLAKSAEEHLLRALDRGDLSSSDAWSQVFSRHSREAVKLMEFKRLVMLDVGLSRASLQQEE